MATMNPKEQFPHPELTAITADEKPDFTKLHIIHQQMNANAMSIPSLRGGGQHGHLATVVTAIKYDAITDTHPWEDPQHPGAAPVHVDGSNQQI